MTFHQDNFLGSVAGAGELQAQIDDLSDKAFFKDGSKSMEGPISMANNTIVTILNADFSEVAVGPTPPSGQVSLYAKTDDHLYIKNDLGVESQLSSGGDVDGPASAVDENLCSFDGVTGKLIKDSLIASSDVTIGAASSNDERVVRFDGVTGKLLQNSVIALTDLGNMSGLVGLSVNGTDNIELRTSENVVAAVDIQATTGGISIDAFDELLLESRDSGSTAVVINASNATGGVFIVAGGVIELSSGGAVTINPGLTGSLAMDFILSGRWQSASSFAGINAISLEASNAAGGIQLNTGTAGVQILGPSGLRLEETGAGIQYVGLVAPAAITTSYDLVLPAVDGDAEDVLVNVAGDGVLTFAQRVRGPASSTDNAIARFDSTTGKLIQNSGLAVDDNSSILRGSTLWMHETGGVGNFAAGSRALDSITTGTNNTAGGQDCMTATTDGFRNTAYGHGAMEDNISGDQNCAFGFEALNSVTGNSNSAYGHTALTTCTTGTENCAYGVGSMDLLNTSRNSAYGFNTLGAAYLGNDTLVLGHDAGSLLTSGTNNIMLMHDGVAADSNTIRIGDSSHTICFLAGVGNVTPGGTPEVVTMDPLTGEMGSALVAADVVTNASTSVDNAVARFDSTTGKIVQNSGLEVDDNVSLLKSSVLFMHETGGAGNFASGSSALAAIAAGGINNTAVGVEAMLSNTVGDSNTAMGFHALRLNVSSTGSTAVGFNALQNSASNSNDAFGQAALSALTTGARNVAVGIASGSQLTIEDDNTAIGFNTLSAAYTGSDTIALGSGAGSNLTSGTGNIMIMHDGVAADNLKIRIGTNQTSCHVAGIDGTTLANETSKILVIDSNDQITAEPNAMPVGYIDGLLISDNSVSVKSISAGSCRSDDNTFNIVTGAITADIATQLDTGAEAADTWYAIWIIADSVTSNVPRALLSLSSSAPTMPSGFDKKRRISWVRNDGSSDFYDYYSTTNGRDRFYLWREVETILELLTNGAATSFANVDISELVPPTSTLAYINTNHVGVSTQDFASFRTGGSSLDPVGHRCFAEDAGSTCFHIETDSTQNIEYENSTAGDETDVWILGYTDSI